MPRNNRITIFRTKKPSADNINEELHWFCDSLGLFGERDKDKSCFRMFVVLLRSLHHTEGLTSDEISAKVSLSRGTVVHHLHKLMGAGLVTSERNKYMLRVENLSSLVEEIERDILKTMGELREAAHEIDERLNL
jgi:DNA-binding transcriptional ArsR family regulator